MTNYEIMEACRKRGWLVFRGLWWKIVPLSLTYPQGVSARTLRRAYKLCKWWEGEEGPVRRPGLRGPMPVERD